MKPWQTPLNKAPSQAKMGKEGTKRENPNSQVFEPEGQKPKVGR